MNSSGLEDLDDSKEDISPMARHFDRSDEQVISFKDKDDYEATIEV